VEELMENMRAHIEHLLASSRRPLSFCVIIPQWEDPMTPCIAKMYANETGSLRRRVVVPKAKHIYLDGFQHTLRDTPFKPVHNTLFLFLQNDAGAEKWPVTDDVAKEILSSYEALAETVRDNPLFTREEARGGRGKGEGGLS
jgi:hypothetical protein